MPSVEKKSLVKRDAFSRYDGCRVVMPNGPFSFFVFSVDVQRVSGSHAERPFFLCVFSVDIQWVSGSHKREA